MLLLICNVILQTLEIIADDFAFAMSTNVTYRRKYGEAKSCQTPPHTLDATMSINLTNTSFSIDQAVSFSN